MNSDNFDRNTYSDEYVFNPERFEAIKEDHSDFDASNFLIGHEDSKTARNETDPAVSASDHLLDTGTNGLFANSVALSMPGAFKYSDQMEIDESPQFTIEADVFHDTYPQDYQGYSHMNLGASSNDDEYNDHHENKTTRAEFSFRRSPQDDNLTPNSNVNGSLHHYDDSSIYSSLINEDVAENVHHHLNPPAIEIGHTSSHNLHLAHGLTNELSPLTTTTSFTPSLSSIHSTQPSFFSAHQYLPRGSLDVTSSHRNSIDVYSKKRNSIDSQNSVPVQRNQISGRYSSFTDSISSYIPFIGDKRHSPISGPPSPASQTLNTPVFSPLQDVPRPQSRHLIRSIFKSQPNNAMQQNIDVDRLASAIKMENMDTVNNTDFLVMSPTHEEPELDGLDPLPSKKVKKPKRSLFTRFKPPVKQEHADDEMANDSSSKNSGGNSSFANEEDNANSEAANQPSFNSMSRTPSSATTVWSSNNVNPSNLDASVSNSSQAHSNEPDYAALFENVGKRKKMVKTASFKSRPKIKQEPDNENLVSDRQAWESFESQMSGESGASVVSEPTTEDATPLSLANASKRILGSKLMKKKPSRPSRKSEAELKNVKTTILSEGIEVEVDLKTLDLPEDTKVFPTTTINSKSRTRGRKENKEADLSDASKIYLCNYCSRRFKRQEHLKRHFRSLHTFEKPYDCPICHKKFSRSDNLNQHLKTHKEGSEEASQSS